MGERLDDGRLLSDKLAVIRAICTTLAYDLRTRGGDERRVRGVLTALIVAIEHDQLESLWACVQLWFSAEVARQDALASEPDLPPHGYNPGSGSLAYVPLRDRPDATDADDAA